MEGLVIRSVIIQQVKIISTKTMMISTVHDENLHNPVNEETIQVLQNDHSLGPTWSTGWSCPPAQ